MDIKMNVKALKNKYNELSLNLEVDFEHNTVRVYKESKRSLVGYKNIFRFRYINEENMIKHLERDIKSRFLQIEIKNKEKAERKERQKVERENVKVGDIFVDSWGYEQTNIDAYEVVEKPTKATVILKSIDIEHIKETSWCSDIVKPIKGSYISEDIKKRLNGNSIKMSSFSSAYKVNESDTFHRSWGY